MGNTMKGVWKSLGAGAPLIILPTAVACIAALRGGIIFDDQMLITKNRVVQADDGLDRFWCTTEVQQYYPLSWALRWLE
jgi:hypothetical protein